MVKNIDNATFKDGLANSGDAILIDVRTPGEYQGGAIPGAINIDVSSPAFQARVMDLDKNKTYYVYCRSGGRSGQAAMFMSSLGFSKVYNLANGIMFWDGEIAAPAA